MKDAKQFVEAHIPQMDSPEKVYDLFRGLGYKTLDTSYRGKEAWGLRAKDKDSVKDIYTIANYQRRFQALLIELKQHSTSAIRSLPLQFEKEIQYPFFVFTSDYQNYTFVLVKKTRLDTGVWKRETVRLNLDRHNAYYTDRLVISSMAVVEREEDPPSLYKTLKQALSVERVRDVFFKDYKKTFKDLRELLEPKVGIKHAHEFSLLLLNRTMFIYFVDKKRWLKNSPRFMKWFWDRYQKEKGRSPAKDGFYDKWLKVLFFEAFNNRFSHPAYLPQDVRDALALAPYLNGGLFKPDLELDELSIEIPDEFMSRVLDFFERYNFTIREDLPLDVEVAVDPQMLGYVYESLANVAETIYEKQDLGIFYTPKVEVDFMCRRSLLEYLSKSTEMQRDTLYRLLFDEDKTGVEKSLSLSDYEKLEESLDDLSVVDPACGSGAFLVGMLDVMVELYKLIYGHLNREMTDYQLKKRIVGNSLYGVDVMPWAAHSAELRLWLSLMIESDLTLGELKLSPLLPNLDLKIRVGDSLVQEIGDISLNLRDIATSPSVKRKLTQLKREKEKYYNCEQTAKFKSHKALLEEELRVFHRVLDDGIVSLRRRKQALSLERREQLRIFEEEASQKEIFDERKLREVIQKKREKIDRVIDTLLEAKGKLREKKLFVWDIAFAEIFGEKGGFDIVIGNPPYVRRQKIAPPNSLRREITEEEKKEYKADLLRSIRVHFPFIKRIDKRSDYYVYFYFHGLTLLNEKGTFCFITSNSWLDVGYGKDLQEFLLKYVPIIAIYDNRAKRSFEGADVNTIIALLAAPRKSRQAFPALRNRAKFVVFKRPFEEVINTKNLILIERSQENLSEDDFRVHLREQSNLLKEGWVYPEGATEEQKEAYGFNIGQYVGNKWGGKYLRAPDVFFTIMQKGTGKWVKLGDVAEVNEGRATGANDFFFVTIEKARRYQIEDKYLVPGIMKTREMSYFEIGRDLIERYFLQIQEEEKKIRNHNVYRYLEAGKKEVLPRSNTLKSKTVWWRFNYRRPADLLSPCGYGETIFCALNKAMATASNSFAEIRLKDHAFEHPLFVFMNSVVGWLFLEVLGRASLGGGMIKVDPIEYRQMCVLDRTCFVKPLSVIRNRRIGTVFQELGIRRDSPVCKQKPNPLPDRKALDNVVFDILGLTQDERDEVYWAVCELVKNRLEKARSL